MGLIDRSQLGRESLTAVPHHRLENARRPELEGADRDPLVGRMDRGRAVEVRRIVQRQEPVGADAQPGEMPGIGAAGDQEGQRNAARVSLAED